MTTQHRAHQNVSLDYCLRFGHLPPADLTTARNVLDHILRHARQAAFEPHEIAAVDAAERNARAALAAAEVTA